MVLFKSPKSAAAAEFSAFTFQYGSIQIVSEITLHLNKQLFTFQYGSIQIIMEQSLMTALSNLHSNMVLFK